MCVFTAHARFVLAHKLEIPLKSGQEWRLIYE